MMDRFELYERCAQDPERDVRILRAIHASNPIILAEDFSGTAALSRRWVADVPRGRAIATDVDPEPLRRARLLPTPAGARVRVHIRDARRAIGKADIIAVFNFSIGELHERSGLLAYLANARSRLRKGGILAVDLYAGGDAWRLGTSRDHRLGPRGERITYTWEQRHADPVTGRVVNTMSFRVLPKGRKDGRAGGAVVLKDAFVYDWRLWSVPELRDAMVEAGFGEVEVFPRADHAVDHLGETHVRPIETAGDDAGGLIVFVVGRV